MRKEYFIFVVRYVVTGASGRHTVIGRCGDFPIRVGDEFERVFWYKPSASSLDVGRPPIREIEKDVSLRVVGTHAYERDLPELGEGMTGSLALEGVGAELIQPGWVLGTIDDAEPRSRRLANPVAEVALG